MGARKRFFLWRQWRWRMRSRWIVFEAQSVLVFDFFLPGILGHLKGSLGETLYARLLDCGLFQRFKGNHNRFFGRPSPLSAQGLKIQPVLTQISRWQVLALAFYLDTGGNCRGQRFFAPHQ